MILVNCFSCNFIFYVAECSNKYNCFGISVKSLFELGHFAVVSNIGNNKQWEIFNTK